MGYQKSSLDQSELGDPWALFEALKTWAIRLSKLSKLFFKKTKATSLVKNQQKKTTSKHEKHVTLNLNDKAVTDTTIYVI